MKPRSFLKQTALSAATLALPGNGIFAASKKKPDYESKVLLDFNQSQLPTEDRKSEGYAFATRTPDLKQRQKAEMAIANK